MHKLIFKYLKSYSTQPIKVDRLIISAFIAVNNLAVERNRLLLGYCIEKKKTKEYESLLEFIEIIQTEPKIFTVELLIELFEFVISPSDKVVNGAVYTPSYVRNYILTKCFSQVRDFGNITVCDPACGCAGFLYTAAQMIKAKTGKNYEEIFAQNIFGVDIQQYSIMRSKLLLSLLALLEGEDAEEFQFNLFHGNTLNFDWHQNIKNYRGFQIIVGNPPYVCSRNMDAATLKLVRNWSVAKTGHPDLYIPFFQIGYENLADGGVLGLITVNTFIKSINGRALRSYLAENRVELTIINFGGEQVFKEKNTYTCLCFLHRQNGQISYRRTTSAALANLSNASFFSYNYDDLNHLDGWNLVDTIQVDDFIRKIESVGKPFKDLYVTRNGIATLKNEVYKFSPAREDPDFFYLLNGEFEYPIEKSICRRIVNANKIKTAADLSEKEEQIIFPYLQEGNKTTIIPSRELRTNYPCTYRYLLSRKAELDMRDKGEVQGYEEWYAFGRRQSMDRYDYKLFFPHICERPTFVISSDPTLLFYNGIAVVSSLLSTLKDLKTLLESDVFFNYIKNTTKDYSSGYISMSRNYLKNFGIPDLTEDEKRELRLATTDTNQFWQEIYDREFDTLFG